MNKYIMIYFFSVLISSASQILLKISAKKQYDNRWKEYLNARVIIAYAIFFCSSILTIYAYKGVPMSTGVVIESSGYIFVTFLSYICLHEIIGKRKFLGMLCIVTGIIFFVK